MIVTPTFSVIIPVYNSAKFIAETIESILSQTYEDYEVIFIDDCSTDNSPEIMSSYYGRLKRLKVLRTEKTSGPSIARNLGIDAAEGQYVAFLDSDDIWLPNKLEIQLNIFRETGANIVYSDYLYIDQHGEEIGSRHCPPEVDYSKLLYGNVIGNSTAAYSLGAHRNLRFKEIGHEDYAFWLDALRCSGEMAKSSCNILVKHRLHSNSLSSNKLIAARWTWDIFIHNEKLRVYEALPLFFIYASKGFMRWTKMRCFKL